MTTWNLQGTLSHLLICNGSSCKRDGGKEVYKAIKEEIGSQGAHSLIHTTRTKCNGRCADSCVVIAYPDGVWYKSVTPESGRELVRKTLEGGRLEDNVVYTYEGGLKAKHKRGASGKRKDKGKGRGGPDVPQL